MANKLKIISNGEVQNKNSIVSFLSMLFPPDFSDSPVYAVKFGFDFLQTFNHEIGIAFGMSVGPNSKHEVKRLGHYAIGNDTPCNLGKVLNFKQGLPPGLGLGPCLGLGPSKSTPRLCRKT